ncbi:hypothetical protein [Cohnella herbarum]|uniref:Uncharacterized protein n=1 Tax=Cohnella herbarum TaxID=2728023 RepID=A0A7Z2ZMH2_9BACL|nr:hypothetical protein [Cohnella herbarum]QJD84979.1 hypothetical protein HH215_18525 [Cohnella herbarum]
MVLNKKSMISLILALVIAASSYYYFAVYNSFRVVSMSADYVGYSSADELYSGAELVVIGRPTEDFEDREMHIVQYSTGAIQDYYTLTDIDIERIVKGPTEIKDLQVIEPLAIIQDIQGKTKLTTEDYTEMKKNKEYLIFLRKNTFGQYCVINMQSGKFNLDQTDPSDFYSDSKTESESIKEHKNQKERIFNEIKAKYL